MSFWQFIGLWFRRSFRRTWNAGDNVHRLCVFVIGALWLVGFLFGAQSLRDGEFKAFIVLPFVFAFLVFLGSLVWDAYWLYREEFDKRSHRERQLTSDRGLAMRQRINALNDSEKAALEKLAIEHRIGGDAIRRDFPGVDFLKISGDM